MQIYSTYEAKKFNLPKLEGISQKSIEEHLGLYAGYVKNFNAISGAIEDLSKDSEKNAHAISELMRRRSFEFGGMRLHERYFAQWEGAPAALNANGPLARALAKDCGSVETALTVVRQTGMMRGPGWSILYFDREANAFLVGFTGEQHQGHFVTLPIILALDVWEHAFILDYGAAGKGKYIDAFFKNLNWEVMEKRFAEVQ
ncbi:MAG: Fe-Mn family superoxide dismutase [bacterium]|nr:Fe-Mn family superoxide dismutase [bacterium]